MIVSNIKGGLGNQMFQYAAGRALSKKINTEIKLDISYFDHLVDETAMKREFVLNKYNISASIVAEDELKYLDKFKEIGLSFNPEFFELKDNTYIDGYFQSENYFKEISEIIRKEFELKESPSDEDKKVLEQIKNSNSIALHVRRTDYVTHKAANDFHGVLTLEYYLNAIKKIENDITNPTFFIFSDDKDWVKENLDLKNKKVIFVDHNDISKGHQDLNLMKHCQHFIIANSTFSWWGAWLSNYSNKVVIAPKNWFKKLEDTNEIIPSEWIKI